MSYVWDLLWSLFHWDFYRYYHLVSECLPTALYATWITSVMCCLFSLPSRARGMKWMQWHVLFQKGFWRKINIYLHVFMCIEMTESLAGRTTCQGCNGPYLPGYFTLLPDSAPTDTVFPARTSWTPFLDSCIAPLNIIASHSLHPENFGKHFFQTIEA